MHLDNGWLQLIWHVIENTAIYKGITVVVHAFKWLLHSSTANSNSNTIFHLLIIRLSLRTS